MHAGDNPLPGRRLHSNLPRGGATPEGKKELIGFQVGLRESAQSWHELLTDIKSRGLSVQPEIAVGDGAMEFWNALDRAFPGTKHQRCCPLGDVNIACLLIGA
jgi:hypothetical protein|tara:strand:+ start:643 stop:951 length:309 start_codon:yes stop_codon:yes gene_type:complete